MKDYREEFFKKVLLGSSVDLNNSDTIIKACVSNAYRDMLTAGRFYIKGSQKDEICSKYIDLLEKHDYQFSLSLIKEAEAVFPNANDLKATDNKYVTQFGLSQKLVNMSFKYFYLFNEDINKNIDYSKCDCPLDSIILAKIPSEYHNNIPWSKMHEDTYLECQRYIRSTLKNNKDTKVLGNLLFDFINW